MIIGLVNQSKKVSAAQIATFARAGDAVLAMVGKDHSITVPACQVGSKGATVLAYVIDNPDVPGAGGYHDETRNGRPYIHVFVDPYLENGGVIISSDPPYPNPLSVMQAATHEFVETALDAHCNLYAQSSDTTCDAFEGCDAVEDTCLWTPEGWVTNYVLPAYFDPNAKGPYDKGGVLRAPFDLSPGGYKIQLTIEGQATQVTATFGPKMPAWLVALKSEVNKVSRIHKRHRNAPATHPITAP